MATATEAAHEEKRGKVCVLCYKKNADRLVSNGDIEIISKYIIEGYTFHNKDFPNGICVGCSCSLSKKWKDPNFLIPNLVDDHDPQRPRNLRSATLCDCRICKLNQGSGFGLQLHHKKRHREWGNDMMLRIGLDGGGGFFKILLSVFNRNDPFPTIQSNLSKKFKESGVRKVFVIALVPDILENYVNVKKLWIYLGIQERLNKKYTIATDLKLCNILLGMMSHSSCHPCCWCDVSKDNLWKKGKPRTISNLMGLFWSFYDANCSKDEAKNYGNVIHPPIIIDDQDDNTPVIQIIPPPELHLMTGPVNTMFKGLENVWPDSEEWLKLCNVKKSDYHGGQFTGNDSKVLLKGTDKIEEESTPVLNYKEAFTKFNDVVGACYGDELKENYVELIKLFSKAYKMLEINITPKVHAVLFHVEEFCSLTGRGLGPWSKQTVEATHHDFNKTSWEKFMVKNMDNPNYSDRLLRAVQEYNSKHV